MNSQTSGESTPGEIFTMALLKIIYTSRATEPLDKRALREIVAGAETPQWRGARSGRR
jgi:hypothetical protein